MKKYIQETVRSVRSGVLDPVYFLNGDDFFLQTYFIEAVENAMSKIATPERIFLVPEPGGYDDFILQLHSIPLFPQPKLFVLQNPAQIKGKNREELLTYCHSPNPDNCLIIIFDKYDPQNKLIRALSKLVGSINSSPPFSDTLGSWVNFFLKERGLTATQDAIDRLLDLSGDSLYHITNEIQKITLGLGHRTKIDEDDVLRYAGWKRSYYPRHFLDAVGHRQFKKAVQIGKSLLNHGSDISKIISLLTNMFLELLFRQLDNRRKLKNDFQEVWLGRMEKKRLPLYLKNYDRKEIQHTLRILARADQKVKTTGNEEFSILIPLLFRIVVRYA